MALSWTQIKKMREDRATLVEEANKLLKTASDEKRELSAEEEARFDEIHTDADKLRKQIELAERQFDAERALANRNDDVRAGADPSDEPAGSGQQVGKSKPRERFQGVAEEVRSAAFGAFLRSGQVDVYALAEELRSEFGDSVADELRALNTVTGSEGGYGVPEVTHNRYIEQLKEINALQRAGATVLTVAANGKYGVPLINDSGNTGDMSAQNAADSEALPVFGEADLTDYRFDADNIPISTQMLRSSVDSIEAVLLQLMATRIGQKQQAMFTTGTGSSQPQGIVTGSTLGTTAASETAITYDDLIDLQYSVKQVYRNMRTCGWMMADATMAKVRKILDKEDRPIFQTSTVLGTPDMILGKPVFANDDMDAPAASAKPIVFGPFERYWIKQVGRVRVVRDPYSQSGKDQVVFHAFHDAGGAIVDPTAIKHMIMDDGS